MPRFCASCGAQVADTAKFCSRCGRPLLQASLSTGSGAVPCPAPAATTSGAADNLAGMLAYVTIIPAMLFLVMEPYNKKPFVRFHAFQNLFFVAAAVVLPVVMLILSTVLGIIPFLGHLVALFLVPVFFLGIFILWMVLLIKAYQGEMWKLPVIGDMAEKQANI